MYLGERWELVFARENLTVRAYAVGAAWAGRALRRISADALWVF